MNYPMKTDQALQVMKDYRKLSVDALYLLRDNRQKFNDYRETIDREGVLKGDQGEVRFKFHGIGCLFTFPDGVAVDIDFGEGTINQMDKYFLFKFFESTHKNYPQVSTREELELMFEILTTSGKIRKNGNKYFLLDDELPTRFELFEEE
jgi:hypothetical protein